MGITEKEISKLNQLDRIEYRQKRVECENLPMGAFTILTYLGLILLFVLGILGGLTLIVMGQLEEAREFLGWVPFLVILAMIMPGVALIIDVILFLVTLYRGKKLDKEYFKVKCTVRKAKK